MEEVGRPPGGYDSTLVLVNGHRLAPAGINGAFTDISVIPLSMIKRIDVLTDGASAVYVSDAMGGRRQLHPEG